MSFRRAGRRLVFAVTSALTIWLAACGGRTPLPDGSRSRGLGTDTSRDAGDEDAQQPPQKVEPLAACASVVPIGASAPDVTLEIVLDGSGSMDSDQKWAAATQALLAIFEDMASSSGSGLAVGLTVFEDKRDPTLGAGPYPTREDVPPRAIDAAQVADLKARLDTEPFGGTPTARVLEGVYTYLRDYVPPAPAKAGPRVVVLMSDGVPDGSDEEQDRCVQLAAIYAYPDSGDPIRTFSIGIGPFPASSVSYDPGFMGELAIAGRTRRSPSCNPNATKLENVCHFQITPGGRHLGAIAQDFIQAMNEIRGRLGPACEFQIVGPTEKVDFGRTTVVWVHEDGRREPVPRSASDGWTYEPIDAPQKVVIRGAQCARILSEKRSYVDVRLVCE